MSADIPGEPDNLITLDSRRRKTCLHGKFLVDEDLDEVTCGKCEERLNPYEVIRTLCKTETRAKWRWHEVTKATEKLEQKSRVLCHHCKRYTRVSK